MREFVFYDQEDAGGSSTEDQSTATATETPWIDLESGKFNDGWKDRLPEDLRSERLLDTVADFPGAIKSLVHHAKMVGKDKVAIPNDKSPEADWEAFHKAAGRPETPADYGFQFGEDVPEGALNKELIDNFVNEMHKAGASKKVMDVVRQFKEREIKSAIESMQAREQQEYEQAEQALKDKWGSAFNERLHLAQRVVSDTAPDDMIDTIKEKIGNDPVILEWIADLGKRLVETRSIDTRITTPTKQEISGQIDELRSTPGYIDGSLRASDPVRHERITNKITELYREMHPE